jgi:hypothetical protein
MKFIVEIDCENDAFKPRPQPEVASILQQLAERVDAHPGNELPSLSIMDSNGNRVGHAILQVRKKR